MRHKLTFIGECQFSWNLISMRAAPWRDLLRRLTPLMTSASLTADSSWVWLNMWNDHHFRMVFVTVGGGTRSSSRFKLILCYRKTQLRIIMPTCVCDNAFRECDKSFMDFLWTNMKTKEKELYIIPELANVQLRPLMCRKGSVDLCRPVMACDHAEGHLWPCGGTEGTQWTWWKPALCKHFGCLNMLNHLQLQAEMLFMCDRKFGLDNVLVGRKAK